MTPHHTVDTDAAGVFTDVAVVYTDVARVYTDAARVHTDAAKVFKDVATSKDVALCRVYTDVALGESKDSIL